MKISGNVAIVTGASSGIGAAIATELAARGATVVVTARRETELEATAKRCRNSAPESFGVVADLSEDAGCKRVVDTALERLGQVDILVNNAGVGLHRHALETTRSDVEELLRVNLLSAVSTTTAVLPTMVAAGHGSIVNVTSVAGYLPNPRESAYGASKAALHLWSHGLAVDLDGTGVHVGVLSPGPIDTEIWDKSGTPPLYQGRKYPPSVVAHAAVQMIERETSQRTAPRRYGAVGILYALPLVGRVVRRGLVRFGSSSGQRGASADPG